MTAIPLGRGSPTQLVATYPPAPRAISMPAYSVLLRVEIARFTRSPALRPGSRGPWLQPCGVDLGPPVRRSEERRLCEGSLMPACASGQTLTTDSSLLL